MKMVPVRRWVGGIAAAALVMTLSACFLAPGRFASDLDIRRDGNFSFSYNGELIFLPLAQKPKSSGEFEPEPCHDEDSYEERPCTAEELADQKSEWEEEQASRTRREKQQAESAKAFLGGIDPSDPRAAEEFADLLRRQAGWNKVENRGNGVFDVEFAVSGKLDHDFVFPTLERFAMANTFVQISRRKDGTVRIDAPGFGQNASGMGLGGMMQSAMAGSATSPDGGDTPVMSGRFTIRTDATILANNTDEGPKPDPTGQRLDWTVSSATPAAPTALLRLTP